MINFKTTREYHVDELQEVVKELSQLLDRCQIITFTGPLGAGKTTLSQALLRAQGITEVITSPTFTYVNAYKNQRGETFYHFDLYRIDSLGNFLEQGFNEYLYQDPSSPLASSGYAVSDLKKPKISRSWALIEWPEVIAPLLTHDVCRVVLGYHENPEKRLMTIECTDAEERSHE